MSGTSGGPDLAGRVVELMEAILATLPPGAAELNVQRSRRDIIARMQPFNPAAAPISIHVEEGVPLIDVTLGKGGFFEVTMKGHRFSDLEEPLDEVRALCLAAVRGNYKERVRLKGGEVVSSTAVVQIGSREEPIHWRQLFTNPFRRAHTSALEYEPYVAD